MTNNWLSNAVCWLVRVDPEILSGCPIIDKFHVISKAMLLGAVAGIALFAWGGFFTTFWPLYIAIPLTLVVLLWVILIDQIMGASRWALQGILATPGKARLFGVSGALVLRLMIGGVTSFTTSYSATTVICEPTIAAQLQRDRDAANAAKRAGGIAEKSQLRQTMLGSLDTEVKAAQTALTALNDQISQVRGRRDEAEKQVLEHQLTANCQKTGGPGCIKGEGPLYTDAITRRDKSVDDRRRAEVEITALESRVAEAQRKHDGAVAAVRDREKDFLERATAIDRRVADEAVPARNDPVMSYMALQKVFASPEGAGARFYAHLMLALLLVVELSYVLASEYFGHATIYMARLIARTKILAAEAANQYRRAAARANSDDDAPPSFRVIPRFGSD